MLDSVGAVTSPPPPVKVMLISSSLPTIAGGSISNQGKVDRGRDDTDDVVAASDEGVDAGGGSATGGDGECGSAGEGERLA